MEEKDDFRPFEKHLSLASQQIKLLKSNQREGNKVSTGEELFPESFCKILITHSTLDVALTRKASRLQNAREAQVCFKNREERCQQEPQGRTEPSAESTERKCSGESS